VVEAVVAKKLVVVAEVVVELIAVKFKSVVEAVTRSCGTVRTGLVKEKPD
jgi:hypothetical protein